MDFYKIDGNGDTLLILRNANRPFAVESSAILWDDALPHYLGENMRESKLLARRGASSALGTDPIPPSNVNDSQQEVRMQVSSKHLKRAAYFRNLAAGDWGDGRRSETGYDYTVTVEGWDEQALYAVVCVLHGLQENLPREVDLEMLGKMAVIADHFQCREILQNGSWMKLLPAVYGRDLLLTFFSSWVIREIRAFGVLSNIIMLHSRGRMHSLDLPIPNYIIDAIDNKRQNYVVQIMSLIDDVRITLLQRRPTGCTPEQCAALHGALMKGLYEAFGHWPLKAPFHGYSIMAIYSALFDIKELDGERMKVNYAKEVATSSPGHSLSAMIIPALDGRIKMMTGVEIRDFMKFV
ncbi:hypothetical protein ACHAQJ_006332 [Trichoderma viride]